MHDVFLWLASSTDDLSLLLAKMGDNPMQSDKSKVLPTKESL
nr:hypothetical protein [Acinetobacter stercoris]